jgi:hypothetical protein
MDQDRRRFKTSLPMPYLEPDRIDLIKRQHEPGPDAAAAEPLGQAAPPEATPVTASPEGEAKEVQPTPTPQAPVPPPRPTTPRRAPQPTPEVVGEVGGAGEPNVVPYGMPTIESTSSEARFDPPRCSRAAVAGLPT